MSPPVGPTGIATTCQGDEPGEPRWHAGASFGIFFSSLAFSTTPVVSFQREAVLASLDYRLSPASTVGFGLGAGLGGVITVPLPPGSRMTVPFRYGITPGWEATVSYSRRLMSGRGSLPFLVLGVSAGGSGAWNQLETNVDSGVASSSSAAVVGSGTAPLYALDVRASLVIGKTFWQTLSPYALARVFGGPVFWSHSGIDEIGGDRYHVQLGVGLVTNLPAGFDVFVEGVPVVGETGVTLGAGKTF